MQDHDSIDRLFAAGLTAAEVPNSRERQWSIVSARLARKRRGRMLWIVSIGVILLTGLTTVYLGIKDPKSAKDDIFVNNQIDESNHIHPGIQPLASDVGKGAGNDADPRTQTPTQAEGQVKMEETIILKDKKENLESIAQPSASQSSSSIALSSTRPMPIEVLTRLDGKFVDKEKEVGIHDGRVTPALEESQNSPYDRAVEMYGALDSNSDLDIVSVPAVTSEARAIDRLVYIQDLLELQFASDQLRSKGTSGTLRIPSLIQTTGSHRRDRIKVSVHGGLFSEYLRADSIADRQQVGIAGGVILSLSHFSLQVGYKNQRVERLISNGLATYGIQFIPTVYGYEGAVIADVNYGSHLLNFQIGYTMPLLSRVDVGMDAGMQVRKIYAGQIDFLNESTNELLETRDIATGKRLEVSDAMIGANLQFKLTDRIVLRSEYRLILPLELDIRWPRRHQFEVGVTYHIYKNSK